MAIGYYWRPVKQNDGMGDGMGCGGGLGVLSIPSFIRGG